MKRFQIELTLAVPASHFHLDARHNALKGSSPLDKVELLFTVYAQQLGSAVNRLPKRSQNLQYQPGMTFWQRNIAVKTRSQTGCQFFIFSYPAALGRKFRILSLERATIYGMFLLPIQFSRVFIL